MVTEDMDLDGIDTEEQAKIIEQKLINEEYKTWKKHAVMLYDVMLSRALDWPTLTTQWFPDVRKPDGEKRAIHRLLIGTHTSDAAPNYLEIAEVAVPTLTADPKDFDEERGEIGGYGSSNKSSKAELKFDITQKIDHDGEVNKARYMPQNPEVIATMCANGTTAIFDRTKFPLQPTGKFNPTALLTGHKEEGYGLHWNPKVEGQLVTGSQDSTVRIWDLKEGFSKANAKKMQATATLTHHSASVNDVEFHHSLKFLLASVSDDHSVQLVDLREDNRNAATKANHDAHSDNVNSIAWNPAHEVLLATGSEDTSVAIWDLRNFKVKLHACEAHKGPVTQVEWHPMARHVMASASKDRRVNLWDLSKVGSEQTPEEAEDGPPELLFMHGGHTNFISDFSFNKNEPWLMASAAEDNLIHIWRPAAPLIDGKDHEVTLEEMEQ